MSLGLLAFLLLFGCLTGVLSAVLGVGGGIFVVPVLVLVVGFDQQEAQATSLLVVLPTAVAATLRLRQAGIGDLPLAGRIGLLGVVGGALGALLALRVSGDVLRYAFAALLVTVGLKLLNDARRFTAPEADAK